MTPLEVLVTSRAGRQIDAALLWWSENRTAAPHLLALEIERAITKIGDLPYSGHPVPHQRWSDVRRVILGHTSHTLYYRIAGKRLVVFAIWHQRRNGEP